MKKGFTLIEVLSVIVIIAIISILIIPNITKNLRNAKEILTDSQIEAIENAAYLYVLDYSSELDDYDSLKVDTISIEELTLKGLISSEDVMIDGVALPTTNVVVVAYINGALKTYYDVDQTGKSVIFLKGLSTISISLNETYNDSGAYVAVPGIGITELTGANMTSNVNTSIAGTYTVTYTYTNSISAIRTVKVK